MVLAPKIWRQPGFSFCERLSQRRVCEHGDGHMNDLEACRQGGMKDRR